MQSRPPKLREAYDLVAKRFGTEMAERLCVENPRAVFFGEEMPPQPEPKGIKEDGDGQGRRKGFLGRLFSS
jgi:protein-tyrosine phosphatase